nr:DUF2218 domain-containing protein [Prauserella isguenensis]
MPTATGLTETSRARRYLSQLCKHLSNRGMHVETSGDTYGFADFGFGTCTLHAHPHGLVIELDVSEPRALKRAQQALTRDIERFGRRDALTVTWGP